MAQAVARASQPRVRPEPRPRVEAPARPAPRPRRAVRTRPRVAGGLLWIVAVAALLAGIVALNVAGLRLGMQAQRLDEQAQALRATNEDLASQLSSVAAAGRIEAIATHRLHLVAPAATTYVRLRPPRR